MALAFWRPGKRAPFFFSSSFFPPGRLFAKREDNSSELALRSGPPSPPSTVGNRGMHGCRQMVNAEF